jgi:pimeloyl-ACP methyl ester carboxylesterase
MAERFVQSGSIKLWTESFGESKNPAVLLIMGAGAQGIFWPDCFCQLLADKGFFVIRYDNRDSGQSSAINFSRHPYVLDDMADDAIALLDAYGISKAHIIGASMGGSIAQLLALNHPERVLSLVLIMSTPDLSVIVRAIIPFLLRPFMGFLFKKTSLPPPSHDVIKFYRSVWLSPPTDLTTWMQKAQKAWHIFSAGTPIDEEEIKTLEERAFSREANVSSMVNHARAIKKSAEKKIDLAAITRPTLIIHGQKDPVFPVEHGKMLAHMIPNARLEIISEMGHIIPTVLSEKLADIIVSFIKDIHK